MQASIILAVNMLCYNNFPVFKKAISEEILRNPPAKFGYKDTMKQSKKNYLCS